jgi:hypothetical protein
MAESDFGDSESMDFAPAHSRQSGHAFAILLPENTTPCEAIMALFDMFSGEGKAAFGAHEGFAGVLLAAAAADGHVGETEGQALWRAVERMKLFSS